MDSPGHLSPLATLAKREHQVPSSGNNFFLWGGLLALALGVAVLVGWHARLPALIQVVPTFVPMQYNTALGFLLVGLGMVSLNWNGHRLAVVSGGFAALTGALTLFQYIFGIDLQIDQLAMDHYITTKTAFPGRMAGNTAVCFVISGVALIGMGAGKGPRLDGVIAGVSGSLVLGLGMVAFVGYFIHLEGAYGWGTLSQMAVHTSVGFIFIGSGLMGFGLSRHWDEKDAWYSLPRWLPVTLGVAVVAVSTNLAQALNAHEAKLVAMFGPQMASLGDNMVLVFGVVLGGVLAMAVRFAQNAQAKEIATDRANRRLSEEILQRRRSQEEVAMLNANLEQLVKSRTLELETANRAKSDFLAKMSHELRTPLNAIIGITELMEEELSDTASSSVQAELIEPLSRVHRSGQHLLALINEILDISRIETQKMELNPAQFDISALLEEIRFMVLSLAETNGNRLVLIDDSGVETMVGDVLRIKQVLFNLIGNACKFTEKGTITVTAASATDYGPGWISFKVADTGIGMTPDQMDQLFQDFVQFHAKEAGEFGGAGLGLAISKKLSELMGGSITVTSDYGKGSVFTFSLPLNVTKPHPSD